MKKSSMWGRGLVWSHAAIWIVLGLLAYITAGAYSFASCWTVPLFYFPPTVVLFLTIVALSWAAVGRAIMYPRYRAGILFAAACHGAILTGGMVGCTLSAYWAAGQVSCL